MDSNYGHDVNFIGACVEIIISESDIFHGLFFQDQEMKQVFSAYPEIIFVDASYLQVIGIAIPSLYNPCRRWQWPK